jgi:hypothetical protein
VTIIHFIIPPRNVANFFHHRNSGIFEIFISSDEGPGVRSPLRFGSFNAMLLHKFVGDIINSDIPSTLESLNTKWLPGPLVS